MFLYIAVKAKNVVTLSVNKIFAQPGIGQQIHFSSFADPDPYYKSQIRIRMERSVYGKCAETCNGKNLNYLLIWSFSYIFIIFFKFYNFFSFLY